MLWYHDHAMGTSRLNLYAGLMGVYLLRDPQEARLKLPSGKFELPLVLYDRIFDHRGSCSIPLLPIPASLDGRGGRRRDGREWPGAALL